MKPIHFAVAAVIAIVLFWALREAAAALAPFALAAAAGYALSPLARTLEARMPPSAAAGLVAGLVLLALLALPLGLLPAAAGQLAALATSLPALAASAGAKLAAAYPDLADRLSAADASEVLQAAAGKIGAGEAADAAGVFLGVFGRGVSALASFVAFLAVTPLAAFYLVRDRRRIAAEVTEWLPTRWRPDALAVARDLDTALGEFMRGQLSVMALMAVLYSAALWIAGLDSALAVGLLSGALSFIPYLGFALSVAAATLAAAGQFDALPDFLAMWAALGACTLLESIVITPWLVGDRVGLHPLFILLALFAAGSLLGFFGVLLALPLAAMLLALSRHARRRYMTSDFYVRPR